MVAPGNFSQICRIKGANLHKKPSVSKNFLANPHTQITKGDLHGNFINILYLLVLHGIIELSGADYDSLVQLSCRPAQELNAGHLKAFKQILSRITVNHHNIGLLLLLGDELADRGSNDYFTLKIFERLAAENIPFEILLSNHGCEFICDYEKGATGYNEYVMPKEFTHSLREMKVLLRNDLITVDEIENLVEKCYKPYLKLISSTLTPDGGIILYTHAPFGLAGFKSLADKFHITYEDITVTALAQTIDKINGAFNTLKNAGNIHTLFDLDIIGQVSRSESDALLTEHNFPFEFLIWSRIHTNLDRPLSHNGYTLTFVHGHDSTPFSAPNVVNLDSMLGKYEENTIDEYKVLYTEKLAKTGLVELH